MMSGKFFLVVFASFLLYTLFINFGYLNFMGDNANIYPVYLYDPEETYTQISPLIHSVTSLEEFNEALATDAGSGVGIHVRKGEPNIVLYAGTGKVDRHRVDYALSLLRFDSEYKPEIVGDNTPKMKQLREITCELLFVEIVAVGFLGIASVLLKDFKQFSLVYLVIALFTATPVFLSANTAIKMDWIIYHPFYHVYMGLKDAFFGMPVTNSIYYICVVCVVILLFGMVEAALCKEMGKEG